MTLFLFNVQLRNKYDDDDDGLLGLNAFVFSRLCIDVVQFCSRFASCHFAQKLS